MAQEKKKYRCRGTINKGGEGFDEYVWAFSPAQAEKRIWGRLKKRFPRLGLFLTFQTVDGVTPTR